ncbi:ultraviolet-sensitive opsin [Anopheles darlingi]|uniref:Ultraviolet-sensitive opsin n=1 Tax=Anopheles darlingi TaxID=43151 RepID=W5JKH4_ANODA|nr:ultraviolet-sensitive opsin [Anopheles darlingi]
MSPASMPAYWKPPKQRQPMTVLQLEFTKQEDAMELRCFTILGDVERREAAVTASYRNFESIVGSSSPWNHEAREAAQCVPLHSHERGSAQYRSLRTPANYLVVNLAVADLLIMLEAPLFIYNSIYQGPAFGSIGCTVYALMGAIGGTVAIGTLTVISIDRYNVVVFPLNPNRSTTKLKCYITIAFTWAYGLLFAGLPALEIGLSRYTAEGFLTACSFDYLDRTYKARVFMFVYFVCAWVLPLVIISYCYARILLAVVNANSIQSNKTKNKTEVKLAGVVVGIIGLWFIAWTPYAVVAMLGVFGYEHYLTPLNSMLPAVFAKIAASIDPYFYAMNHPRYRQMLERMCCNRGAEQGNSQYQTSHYNTRGPSRAGDSEAGEDESVGPSGVSRGRNSSVSNMPSGGARAGSIKHQQHARTGGVAGVKRQASNGDDSSLEISVEM